MVLVEHQPAEAADGGAGPAGSVHDRELRGADRQELAGGCRRTLGAGDHEVAVMVAKRRLAHVGLDDVGELDIADRPGRLLDGGGDRLVALGALAHGPGNGLRFTDLALPVRAYGRQIVGEDVGRPAAI